MTSITIYGDNDDKNNAQRFYVEPIAISDWK